MSLLFLVIIFAIVGYLLANSQVGDQVDDAANQIAHRSRDWWKKNQPGQRKPEALSFRRWALQQSRGVFPPEFNQWLASLSEEEARAFETSLAEYAGSLGFKLDELVEDGLDRQPMMKQVFVETIVIYSPAYRKAKEAQQKAEKQKETQAVPGNGKTVAEKQTSRRQSEPTAEIGDPAPAA